MRTIGFKIDQIDDMDIDVDQQSLVPCDFQHAICFGMTGSGKTASLILPAIEERLGRGHSVVAYTYKGHEHRKIKYLAKEAGRLEDVMEIGKPHGKYINLLSFLELKAVNKVFTSLIGGNISKNGDNYWTLSAARLGVAVVDILRKIDKVDQLISKEFGEEHSIRKILIKKKDTDGKTTDKVSYEYPKGDPSFKTVAEITKSPRSLKNFFLGLDEVVTKINNIMNKKGCKESSSHEDLLAYLLDDMKMPDQKSIQRIALAHLRLEEAMKLYKEFTIDVDAEDGGGNNGVLQVLNNGILNIAKLDYVNSNEVNILDTLNEGSVLIIDIEGLDTDVHGVLLESILSKLSSRIRHGKPQPVSVFIDEANRVLLGDMDIHNDTLRESNVELILAAQNEEQMIEKFGGMKWESLRKNFKHNYAIDEAHYIFYNDVDQWKGEARLISDEEMKSAEYAFNALDQNKEVFRERFMFEGDLPEMFMVAYDIVTFEKEMSLYIIDQDHHKKEVEYIGKEFKKRLEKEMVNLGYTLDSETKKLKI